MSADAAMQAALVAALEGHAGLAASVNGVFVGRPARATPPWIEIGETIGGDWSSKTERGRELRVALIVRDEGEGPARLHGVMRDVEAAVEGMARDLDGWRVASLTFLRSRVLRAGDGSWTGVVEYRFRVMED